MALNTTSATSSASFDGRPSGTLRWNAPELQPDPMGIDSPVNSRSASRKSDVWAFATTSWEVLTGGIPYANSGLPNDVFISIHIRNGRTPAAYAPWPADVPADVVAVLTRCWLLNASDRPRMDEVAALLRSVCSALPHGESGGVAAAGGHVAPFIDHSGLRSHFVFPSPANQRVQLE